MVVLDSAGNLATQKEIDDANKNPRSANFTTPSGAQGVTNPKY